MALECALAQPAHHRHQHKQRRDLANVNWQKVDYDLSSVDWSKVDYTGGAGGKPGDKSHGKQAAAPVANASPKVVDVVPVPVDHGNDQPASSQPSGKEAPADKPSSDKPSEGSSGSGIVKGAHGGAQGAFGGRTEGRQGGNKDLYIGNVGSPFGSNMMLVDTATAQDKYEYTITFKNTGSKDIKVIVWQNPGRDGSPLGGKGEDPIITIPLGGGQSQAVAFDEDTHGAFSLDCARDNPDGSTVCARGEYNFGDQCPPQWDNKNGAQGWSGFDRSTIMGGSNDHLSMSCLNCGTGGPQLSAKGKNEWLTDDQQNQGAGGAIKPGPAHLVAEMSA
ncbi:MAG: hypothetical protein Q9174_002295 [Haloplaca sp. 1 TL-2023]